MSEVTISYKTVDFSINGELEATVTYKGDVKFAPKILQNLINAGLLKEFHLSVKED